MPDITPVNLAGIDLNLLVAFEALMTERNVTRAAASVGLTQSAMSNTLARLRALLDDPLLVRTAGGMLPTDRAIALAEPIGAALKEIRRALVPEDGFDPRRARNRFRIVSADVIEAFLFPLVLERLGREAPGVDLEIDRLGSGFPIDELRTGHADLAVGTFPNVPQGFVVRKLFDEELVSVVRRAHPLGKGRLTLARFVELGHVLVSPYGRRGGVVDQALAERGLERRVAVQTRHFLIAPVLVSRTDLVATIPRRMAEWFAPRLGLRILKTPIPLDRFPIQLAWHPRTEDSPAHAWLRGCLTEVARAF